MWCGFPQAVYQYLPGGYKGQGTQLYVLFDFVCEGELGEVTWDLTMQLCLSGDHFVDQADQNFYRNPLCVETPTYVS